MDIAGNVALVTGAGSGLGAATAQRLADRGALVVGLDRHADSLARFVEQCPGAIPVHADVTDSAAIAHAVATAIEAGALRVAVNCAATGLPASRTVRRDGAMHPLQPWRDVIDTNLVAAYDVTRQVARAMAQQDATASSGRGVIVHLSSIAGLDGSQGVSAYASAKLALTAMVQSTARDLGIWGIRVMAVAPGAFDTAMVSGLPEEIMARRLRDMVYPKRLGRPDELASFVQHIVENDYLNAECVRLDAGLRIIE
ncbi:NAD(P)-dependent dehydrogenase (short-subunit alcohol dehydrogenase family) [Tamaricihabitans halophyticus]|uniref:NAD(P)-dependent dehydrogenase (Short-subunit alcohol dehydrogenase family) n=1 Tax=Tamaricihabitans halophyticus TaxID=1262583 RepID=A0A4R2QU40_9PSEU|nr:SDR family NAD(P)-dependent oxidoreductase [Tamaricihabitans halophyticus]TCP53473.1 NAD(P)-dependent dehydrogenase (short-subunit alcohol dehydrogenase family) [Tamaricihabitans halophyticus]